MIGCIDVWYSEVYTFEQLEKMHFEIKKEMEKQFLYTADVIAKEVCKEE